MNKQWSCRWFVTPWRSCDITVMTHCITARLIHYIHTEEYAHVSRFVAVRHRLFCTYALQWRHNGRHSGSNHQPHDCFLSRLFRRRSKKTWKLRGTGLCAGNSPGTGEFPAQMASNAENVSIWWRHHVVVRHRLFCTYPSALPHWYWGYRTIEATPVQQQGAL